MTLTETMAQLLKNELVPDLEGRARMPGVDAALRHRWEKEKAARRTSDAFEIWVGHVAEQVGAAWILSVAFIRTMEDRGLLERRRLAGPEAFQSEHNYFQLFPALGPRDYLLTVLRELSRLPGVEDLLGPKHNLAWRLPLSNTAAQKLLDAWRADDEARTPLWALNDPDTRFLGDLYQDLSADARERFALLQTPHFIEQFILKLTLEPAVQEFGLDDVRVIDPTCGSGHFLLGAYERLFDWHAARHPGTDRRAHALAALAQVHGVDLNPYAVAVARFRLTLAFLDKAGIAKLKDVPRLPLHLAVSDSLITAAPCQPIALAREARDEARRRWEEAFDFEDERDAETILARRYHVVVGNPPFGNPASRALKDLYRTLYRSASGRYILAAPFTERFFQLATTGGFVGLINGSTFADHLFGKELIEKVLPSVELSAVINSAGVYFPPPGFATPTLLLFGRNRSPETDPFVVLQRRMDPDTYADPAEGRVWKSVVDHWADAGYEDDFIRVRRIDRERMRRYPWILSGGAASEYVTALEACPATSLREFCAGGVGFSGISAADDVFQKARHVFVTQRIEGWARPHLTGEVVRDYTSQTDETVFWPYDAELKLRVLGRDDGGRRVLRWLAPARPALESRATFGGKTYATEGRPWYEWHQITKARVVAERRVIYPELCNEVHFLLADAGASASQSLMVFVPRGDLTDDQVHALVGYLNSSTVAAWIKERCARVATARGDVSVDKGAEERIGFRLPANRAECIPVPNEVVESGHVRERLSALHRALRAAGAERDRNDAAVLDALRRGDDVAAVERSHAALDQALKEKSVVLQEEIDWIVYGVVRRLKVPELVADGPALDLLRAPPEARPHCMPVGSGLSHAELKSVWSARRELIDADPALGAVEAPLYKRSWRGRRGSFGRKAEESADTVRKAVRQVLLSVVEMHLANRGIVSVRGALSRIEPRMRLLIEAVAGPEGVEQTMTDWLLDEAVPYASALRLTEEGLSVLSLRQARLEARVSGNAVIEGVNYPEFSSGHFRKIGYWRLRNAQDVWGERFISYPGAEPDDDTSPLIGWAGWSDLERAQALAALYQERKDEAWAKERLTPLLAGLLELIPWLKQWHNEPDPSFGNQRLGDYFAQYVESEARENGLTLDDLRAWRPTPARRGGRRRARRAEEAPDA